MEKARNIALLLAGGYGERMHADIPKQFISLRGKPVILHTIQAFERHPQIDEIAIVCQDEWKNYIYRLIKNNHLQKVKHIFKGGPDSHTSIHNGIDNLYQTGNPDTDIVLVHEAVRPLISARIISDCISVCRDKGNAITAIRDNEAVMYSIDGIASEQCYPREWMYRAQTPHTFFLSDLKKAYNEADHRNLKSQSLYTLMAELKYGPLYIVKGDRRNLKLTYPEDFRIAEIMLDIKI